MKGKVVEPLLLRVSDVAKLINRSESATWPLIMDGTLPSMKVGGQRRVSRVALEKWIAEKTELATAAGR